MIDTTYPDRKFGGFVSTADGNDPVRVDRPLGELLGAAGGPAAPGLRPRRHLRARPRSGGATVELTAHLADHFRILYLNARHPDRSQLYQDAQIFCPYTRHDTGERGAGLLELGKHLAGPGIADRRSR